MVPSSSDARVLEDWTPMMNLVDFPGGWRLLTSQDGTPLLLSPSGETTEVPCGPPPDEAWVRALYQWHAASLGEPAVKRLAACRTLDRWMRRGSSTASPA